MTFEPLPAQPDLPAIEHEILARWKERDVFARSLARTADGPLWTLYEGPPTANGKPGTHHVEARVFKDVFPRFQTMRGRHVPRRAGWDCHGLPVELEVEKRLGFTGKGDIEAYGVAEFNARCRESVQEHVDEFVRLTERMGYWVDFGDAYWTMTPAYIDSVWWSLKTIFDAGLLVQDHRVTPYCPRCGTGLSDHEVAQAYYTVTDPSVYVRFPLLDRPDPADTASLLIWTTTPWTLISNTAVAVHPDVTYAVAEVDGERLVVAEPLVERVLGADAVVVERFAGTTMEHWRYRPPFDLVPMEGAHYVGLADYVTITDGTGLVHQSPAFGADDLAVARRYGLPVVNPVRPDGTFDPQLPLVGGLFFKQADPVIVDDLRDRGLLWRSESYEHSYPHCWRCDTPLLYYALPSWYIRTTAIKDRLLAENEQTDWHPPTIRQGRYGDWLNNNIDWALSRDRYWGTPLPIWRCDEGHLTCVGSRAELSSYAGHDVSGIDPHRPAIDEVTFPCPKCDAMAARVPQVIDAWYDSGSMPFAQFGYPHRNVEEFERNYPADFICEAIDQTRGWFYTLMAVGTLVFDRSSYRTVLCLGHIVDAEGRKMSKHLGNVLDPFELFERHGADALRWLMLAVGNPWSTRRVGHELLDEIVRKVLLTYWNTASFFCLYAHAEGWSPAVVSPSPAERPVLDRWALSELHATVEEVTAALEQFDSARAGRQLTGFIDNLSNWYVRRSRRRFWDGEPAALATLHDCLTVLTGLLAPFTPFLTDYLFERLVRPVGSASAESVHLTDWPVADSSLIDPRLGEQMALVRRLVELGRAARAESGVKTRQPLARALVSAPGWRTLPAELKGQLADELNVRAIEELAATESIATESLKPNFRALGRRFAKQTAEVAAAVREHGRAGLSEDGQTVTLTVDGQQISLAVGEEVTVTREPKAGWASASDAGETLALDVQLTPELVRAGIVRDVIRLVQDARKAQGLDVSDRIELWWESADSESAEALRAGTAELAAEVLAVSVGEGRPAAPLAGHQPAGRDLTFWLRPVG